MLSAAVPAVVIARGKPTCATPTSAATPRRRSRFASSRPQASRPFTWSLSACSHAPSALAPRSLQYAAKSSGSFATSAASAARHPPLKSGGDTFGEVASDAVVSDEVASDEVASDEVASDEVASDEVASDEGASDEGASDEGASDEVAS